MGFVYRAFELSVQQGSSAGVAHAAIQYELCVFDASPSGDGGMTAAAQGSEQAAFGAHGLAGVGIVQGSDAFSERMVTSHLQAKSRLTGRR